MKHLVHRETIRKTASGCVIKKRSYLKLSSKGWTFDPKYERYTFKTHKQAQGALAHIKHNSSTYRFGIEPVDNLHHVVIY
ncbi:hypothetical protein N9043_01025 [bacterium]|nr:hypothetical protein [bacterium]